MPSIIKTASRRNPATDEASTNRPKNAATGPHFPYGAIDIAIFLCMSMSLIFAMCATGRPGA